MSDSHKYSDEKTGAKDQGGWWSRAKFRLKMMVRKWAKLLRLEDEESTAWMEHLVRHTERMKGRSDWSDLIRSLKEVDL